MKELFLAFDQTMHDWFLLVRSDELTGIFKFVTQFGNWNVIVFALLCATALLYFRNRKHAYVLPVWISFISASGITYALKLFFARPRPLDAIVIENTLSFPSMHATLSVAVYGLLVYLVIKNIHTHLTRNVFVFIGLSLILLIGVSRLYLGVHYASDVLAGYVVGGVGVFLAIYLHKRFTGKTFM